MRHRTAAAAVLTVALVACGVPSDETARPLPVADVPFDLLAPSPTASPQVPAGSRAVRLYLVRGDVLVPTIRRFPAALTPVGVVRALVAGPVGDESQRGLRTAIPGTTEVLAVDINAGIADVDLSAEFTSVGAEQQILALAQLVYSLTEFRTVRGVRFRIEGKPVQVPREDGALTGAPLVRADYDAVTRR